jgi:uncharacterized protein
MSVSKPGPSRCVLLFAREPRAEAAAKGIRRGEALFALARSRVVEAAAALPDVTLVFVPPASQSGGGFGERLEHAFHEASGRGYDEIVAVPGDVPQLTAEDLGRAFRALSSSGTVLGPSPDGGVWLIGLCARHVALSDFFERVPWRTRRVFEVLLSNAPLSAVLVERGDVDLRADALRTLRAARVTFDLDLVAALEALVGASPSFRTAGVSLPERAPFSWPLPSRAPPLLLLTF